MMRFPRSSAPINADIKIRRVSEDTYEIEIHVSEGPGSLIFDTVLMRIHDCMRVGDQARLEGDNKVVFKTGNFEGFLKCLKSFSGMNITLVE